MKTLDAVPTGYRPRMTNGQAVLYVSVADPARAVLVNDRTGTIVAMATDSALARGYWTDLPVGWRPKKQAENDETPRPEPGGR